MQLKISQVFDVVAAIGPIIAEKRPMPQVAKWKLARMQKTLLAEFDTANAQRTALIEKYGSPNENGQLWVPPEKMPEFTAEWQPIADSVVEVDVEPLKLADFGNHEALNGPIEVSELLLLGDLITE